MRYIISIMIGMLMIMTGYSAILTVPSPYTNIQHALNFAVPGDTILPDAGTYTTALVTKTNGTSENPIILDGRNGVIVNKIDIRHAHHHIINMTFEGPVTSFQSLVLMNHGGHYTIFSNNVVDLKMIGRNYGINWQTPAVRPFGLGEASSHNLIISNTLKNSLGYIFMSIMGDSNVVHGNTITNGPSSDAFRLFGRNSIIRGNIVVNHPYQSGLGNHPDFIQTFGNNGYASSGHIIEQNFVSGIEGGQITQLEGNLLPDTGNWIFRNNIFKNIALGASCTIPGIKYINNTFINCNYLNGGHVLTFSKRVYGPQSVFSGESGTNYAHNIVLLNNIFANSGGTTYTNRGWYGFDLALTNLTADYNYVGKNGFLAVKSDPQQRVIGGTNGWSTFDWYEPHGINGGNPNFVDYDGGNYRLTTNSILVNDTGIDASEYVQNDYDYVSRPQGSGWSIGAFEYVTGSDPDPEPEPEPEPPVILPKRIFTGTLRIISP